MAIKGFVKGNTRRYKFQFGTGVNITGWKIYLTFKASPDDADPGLAQISTTAGDDVLDDTANGLMYVFLDQPSSESLDVGKIYYEFTRIIPGPPLEKTTLDKGTVKIEAEYTQVDA
jgi:hypothetical protein